MAPPRRPEPPAETFLIVLVAGLVLGDPNREPGEADVPVVIAGGDDEAPAEASTELTAPIASDIGSRTGGPRR